MSYVLSEQHDHILFITLNREKVHNAFDDALLIKLQQILDDAHHDAAIRAIVLKANGKHFSAGADLNWMKRMVAFSEEENIADANILANVMHALHSSPKPTIAMVQGAAFGGGAGLVAACDIAIAADNANFCFSEVKLGLIPAVISPYVTNAVGARNAAWLFMSAEKFTAEKAQTLQLVQHVVPLSELLSFTTHYAKQFTHLAPEAVSESKSLVYQVTGQPINKNIINMTAELIARKRVSKEGQQGLQAFLNKEKPHWN